MSLRLGDKVLYTTDTGDVSGIVDELYTLGGRHVAHFADPDGTPYVAMVDDLVLLCHASLSDRDHAELVEAAHLIKGVMDRHNGSLTGPALVALTQAITDMRIGERYLGVAEMLSKERPPTPGEIADRTDGRANGRVGAGSWNPPKDPLAEAIADRIVGPAR